MGAIGSFCKRLHRSSSGNAAMIVALGMPALIGGTGLAVDTAQWYLWKRELQFAVDQAAIAGAWAMSDEDTEDSYQTRAAQEFGANLSVVADFASDPTVELRNWSGGSSNSVGVSATATRKLPFSSFLTGNATTIYAYAQASFEEGATFTSCLVAVDEDDEGAITIGGSTVLTASCGLAALSTDDESIKVNGSPDVDAGWVISAGGIDEWFKENTDDEILEYQDGLTDPFADLTPPNPTESQTARTYSCTTPTPQTTADVTEEITVEYSYYRGANQNNANLYNYNNPKSDQYSSNTYQDRSVPAGSGDGTTTSTSTTWTHISGNGQNRIWEVKTVTTETTYANTYTDNGVPQGTVLPGTYSDIKVKCNTTFSTGVYIIDGGSLEVTGQYEVTGSNVMFVLKNGASLKITGGADINLTAIQASDLIARGVDSALADKLAGMLVFEERSGDAAGKNENKINGNADTVLNGTIYLPKSAINFAGTASVTSQCLMIAASTINLTGTTNMTTFCPSHLTQNITVVNTAPSVKLVT